MQDKIKILIREALKNLGIKAQDIVLEHPTDLKMGDYSTNVSMVTFRKWAEMYQQQGQKLRSDRISITKAIDKSWDNPKDLAKKIVEQINKNLPKEISKVEVAGPGFINFYLSPEFLGQSMEEIADKKESFGKNDILIGENFFIEHTQPNPFKEF